MDNDQIIREVGKDNLQIINEIEDGMNKIFKVRFKDRDAVLKLHTEQKSDDFYHNYESLMIQKVSEKTSIPVPEILYISESEDPSFFIMEDIDGISGEELIKETSIEQKKQVMHSFGNFLKELHKNIRFEQFGYLKRGKQDIEFSKTFSSWEKLLSSHIEQDIKALNDTAFAKHISRSQEFFQDNRDILQREFAPVAIHDDNRFSNIIWNKEINGMIDWATGYNGTSEFDAAKAEFLMIDHDLYYLNDSTKDELRHSFYKGYREDLRGTKLREFHRFATIVLTMKGFPYWKESYPKAERTKIKKNLERNLLELV